MPGDGSPPRVLVVGLGGIGGIVAASLEELAREGAVRVTALTTNDAVARSIDERGYLLRGMDGPRTVPGRAVTSLGHGDGPYDFVLLAVPPTSVVAAARQVAPHLAEDGHAVCLQNGLCEERVAPVVGAHRVIGAIVSWGASMPEPGVFERTAAGGFTLGCLGGQGPAAGPLRVLASLLEPVGPVTATANLAGARFSKLAINCAISTLGTIGGTRLGELLQFRDVRRLALEIMSEAVAVARASGVALEKVAGTVDLAWLALTPAERAARGGPTLVAKHALLLAVGARYRHMRSSMLAAIERGRPPSVDYLNGEIVERGAALGVATPANQRARDLVHAIARGEVRPSVDGVRALARDVIRTADAAGDGPPSRPGADGP